MNDMNPTSAAVDELCAGLKQMSKTAPGGLQNFQALLGSVKPGSSPGNLAQSKALIGLAMAVAQRCNCCIDLQSRCAAASRIDRIQVVAAIRRAILMADGPALAYGANALTQFDRLRADSGAKSRSFSAPAQASG